MLRTVAAAAAAAACQPVAGRDRASNIFEGFIKYYNSVPTIVFRQARRCIKLIMYCCVETIGWSQLKLFMHDVAQVREPPGRTVRSNT